MSQQAMARSREKDNENKKEMTMPGLANGMGAAGRRLGSFEGWQTAVLNRYNRTRLGLANGMKAAKKRLGSFVGWQTASLNVHKRILPGLAKACELQGRVWAVLRAGKRQA